ncbi:MAG: Mrp/NBP35 family ATP-binding protein [bacterium]|nr:Mrp/NBP35 family ATP-binding protein [bacterium]
MVQKDEVLKALETVIDPDLKKDLVTLGMIQDLVIEGSLVSLRLVLTTPACPFRGALEQEVKQAIRSVPGITEVHLVTDANVPQMSTLFQRSPLPGVRNIIAIASGKGGVGKSASSVNIASALAQTGARVGLLDADIYGPSIPTMMGIHDSVEINMEREIVPIEQHGIKLVSFGFIAKDDIPIIWRGPLASKAVRQFLKQVTWGELDYLVIDMPPGTGDVHLTLFQAVPLSGGVIVTTPQDVACADASRALQMFKTLGVKVLGIIENMAGDVFGQGGGEKMSATYNVPFLGRIPLDSIVRESADAGIPLTLYAPDHAVTKIFHDIAQRLAQEVSKSALSP